MRCKLFLVIALTVTMAALVACHVHGVNGPFYWKWTWRRLGWARLYPAMMLAAAPFFAGQFVYARRQRVGMALVLVSISTLALQFAAINAQPPFGLNRPVFAVQNSVVTSYYTAATFVKDMGLADWLSVYDRFITQLMIHARFKPPGLILFYWALIRIFGEGRTAALVGASIMAIGAALGPAATYGLVKHFARGSDGNGDDARDGAFCAASFFALCPSLILFFPQSDQVYPAMSCALLVLWSLAISTGRIKYGIAAGAALALLIFFSYIFLALGMFMAVMTMLHAAKYRWPGFWRAAAQGMIFLGTVAVLYLAAWKLLGFDPIVTAHAIRRGQAADLVLLSRPFPYHLPFDALDLALGTGWISFLLAGFYLVRVRKDFFDVFHQSPAVRLVFLALLEIVVVIGAALLPGEGARLFLPLMPLLMAPIGLELSRWPVGRRMVVYVCLFLITCVICQNMIFLYCGPEIEGLVR